MLHFVILSHLSLPPRRGEERTGDGEEGGNIWYITWDLRSREIRLRLGKSSTREKYTTADGDDDEVRIKTIRQELTGSAINLLY